MLILDGCDELCNIELGWTCTNGDNYKPDICVEIPGDIYWVGIEECEDNNLINGDCCSANQIIEWDCECAGGGPKAGPDICKEICGSGYDLEWYECDDGNLNNYDGCTDKCTIEWGYQC